MIIGVTEATTMQDEDRLEQLLDDLELAQPVSEQRQADAPHDGADDVEECETP